ncbi:MAG: CDP-archaeol synthase [Acidimicrobiales bacterium]
MIVGLGLGVVALILFGLGPKYAMALVVAVVVVATAECLNAVRRAGYQPAVLLGLVASAAFPLAVYWKGFAAYPVLGVLVVMAGLLWHLVGADGDARVVESVGVTLFGVAWIGGLASFAALMLRAQDGVGMLIAAVLATVAYDVAGFAVGRNTGTRPLSEVSPNKTWEGLAGGMFAAALVTTIGLSFVLRLDPFDTFGDALIVGLVAAVAAPLGDLCESLVKRDLGIKDMGSVLPGHGGVLDRFDAMLFVLPAVFYAALFFELGPFG